MLKTTSGHSAVGRGELTLIHTLGPGNLSQVLTPLHAFLRLTCVVGQPEVPLPLSLKCPSFCQHTTTAHSPVKDICDVYCLTGLDLWC